MARAAKGSGVGERNDGGEGGQGESFEAVEHLKESKSVPRRQPATSVRDVDNFGQPTRRVGDEGRRQAEDRRLSSTDP